MSPTVNIAEDREVEGDKNSQKNLATCPEASKPIIIKNSEAWSLLKKGPSLYLYY